MRPVRRSTYRCRIRIVSSTSTRPSTWNGTGSDADRISTVVSPISISPVARSGFAVPLGPLAHRPGHRHDELVADVVGAVDDALDHTGPIAKVEEGQVLTVLAPGGDPAGHGHHSADVGAAQTAAVVGTKRCHAVLTPRRCRPGPAPRPRRRPWRCCAGRRSSGRSRIATVPSAISLSPTISAQRAPDRSAALHLGSHRAVVEGPLGRDPGLAELVGQVTGGRAVGDVDDPDDRSSGLDGRMSTSASQARSSRSMPIPKPTPGVGGPPSSSTRPS